MSNTIFNKVTTSDGTILIDLSSDTVTSSNHIVEGHIGHLADGTQVTGIFSGLGGDYTRTTIVPSQTITATLSDSAYSAAVSGSSSGLASGNFYIVTYDGVEYISSCKVLWNNNYCLGTITHVFGPAQDTVFPFAIIFYNGQYETYHQTSGQHTIKIELLEFVNPVSYQTIYQGSANPTSGTGVNGDIYIKS